MFDRCRQFTLPVPTIQFTKRLNRLERWNVLCCINAVLGLRCVTFGVRDGQTILYFPVHMAQWQVDAILYRVCDAARYPMQFQPGSGKYRRESIRHWNDKRRAQ
jgi:hypothetical protein